MVVEPNCKERDVTEFIRGHVEGAEFTRVHGKELSYTLPLDQVAQFSGRMTMSLVLIHGTVSISWDSDFRAVVIASLLHVEFTSFV